MMSIVWAAAALVCFVLGFLNYTDPFEFTVLGMLCLVLAKLNMMEAE